jgi:hypothetical protein
MSSQVHEAGFEDGFALGELTGRLKHESPVQIRQWLPLDRVNDFKGVLRKYNYSITGLTAHPTESNQVLMVAEKTAGGTNPKLVQAFTQGDRFMDGWEAGCLHGLLHYTQPAQVEQWVKVTNLDAIQKVLDENNYAIVLMRIHPQDKRWVMVTAHKSEE